MGGLTLLYESKKERPFAIRALAHHPGHDVPHAQPGLSRHKLAGPALSHPIHHGLICGKTRTGLRQVWPLEPVEPDAMHITANEGWYHDAAKFARAINDARAAHRTAVRSVPCPPYILVPRCPPKSLMCALNWRCMEGRRGKEKRKLGSLDIVAW